MVQRMWNLESVDLGVKLCSVLAVLLQASFFNAYEFV